MNKNILILHECTDDVKAAWKSAGFSVFVLTELKRGFSEKELQNQLICYKKMNNIGWLFSFGFVPNAAKVCQKEEIGYICWEQDCPLPAYWNKAALFPNNYIFVFDKKQYCEMVLRGFQNVWYLPLATSVNSFQKCIQEDQGKTAEQYSHDVAFVGNLYNDEDHSLYDKIKILPSYLRGYIDGLMIAQRKVWGIDLITEALNENVLKLLRKYVKFDMDNEYDNGFDETMYKVIIGQKIAQQERMEVCSYLAAHFDFVLYTGGDTSFDDKIVNKGYANYLKQMPLIFYHSKINIHITMRTITSGIPLRVLDVLACEGFLLTNYQPEIAEYFVDGEELVIYQDFQDMYEKIEYYLSHEEERKRIAHAGFLKVREYFNYDTGIREILKVLEKTNEESPNCL